MCQPNVRIESYVMPLCLWKFCGFQTPTCYRISSLKILICWLIVNLTFLHHHFCHLNPHPKYAWREQYLNPSSSMFLHEFLGVISIKLNQPPRSLYPSSSSSRASRFLRRASSSTFSRRQPMRTCAMGRVGLRCLHGFWKTYLKREGNSLG